MPKYKVLYTDTCFPDTSIESAELAAIDAELILAPATDEDSLIAAGKDCDGVIFDFAPMTDRVLSNLPKCKVASRVGIGLNNIDIPAASRNGIMDWSNAERGISVFSLFSSSLMACCSISVAPAMRSVRACEENPSS